MKVNLHLRLHQDSFKSPRNKTATKNPTVVDGLELFIYRPGARVAIRL